MSKGNIFSILFAAIINSEGNALAHKQFLSYLVFMIHVGYRKIFNCSDEIFITIPWPFQIKHFIPSICVFCI